MISTRTQVERNHTLTNQVYLRLKEQIINRKIEAGSRLIVGQVAEQLGTSLTPVRETLRLLEKDGLVTTVPHRGTVVTSPTRKQFEDIFMVRAVIEGLAVRMACPWFTSEDHKKLEEILNNGRAHMSSGDTDGWIGSDEEFHRFISEKCDNAFLQRMLAQILEHVRIFRRATANTVPSGVQAAIHEHDAILSALKENNPSRAEKRMAEHIESAFRLGIQGIS